MKKHRISFDKAFNILLILITGGVCLLVFYFIIFPSQGYFQSDCADTIYWAKASYDSGKLISDSFNYSALLPFGASLIMIPLISIFGVSMTTHIIGMAVFGFFFITALFFLFHTMELGFKWSLIAVDVVLLTVSSSVKLREIFWGHVIYYSLGMLFLFVGLSFVCKLTSIDNLQEKNQKKSTLLLLFLLFVWTGLTALNGISSLAIYSLPLIGAVIAVRYFDPTVKLFADSNKFQFNIAGVLSFAVVVGLVSLKIIRGEAVAGYAEGYSNYSDMVNWIPNFLQFFPDWFSLLGVNANAKAPLASAGSLLNMIRIAGGITLLAAPVAMLFQYKKINDKRLKLLLWSHIFLSAFIFYAFILGSLSSAEWRLSPIVASSAVVSIVYARWLWEKKGFSVRKSIIVATALILPCFISASSIISMPADYGRDNELYSLTRLLEKNKLDYGYASFWYAQPITVISNSKVEVRNVTIDDKGCQPYEYQSQKNWFEDQKDQKKYFLILNSSEYDIIRSTVSWDKLNSQVKDDILYIGYHILVFDENIF